MATLTIQQDDSGTTFTVKVIAGSNSPTRICGLLAGMIKVKVSAAPEKGKANKCLIEFLADQIGVRKNQISIISGQTSPLKNIKITGISAEALLQKLKLN
jgi:uncharacterized protein